MRAAVLDDFHDAYRHIPSVERLRQRAEVAIFTKPFGSPAALAGFDALVANRERTRFTAALLAELPDVRLIVQTGNRAPNIDLPAAHDRGIVVGKAAGGASSGAAELAIGLMIAVMRDIPSSDAALKAGRWPAPLGRQLAGKILGLVGLGGVGSQVAKLATAFGMHVLAWSPSLTSERAAACGAEYAPLDALLAQADVVSVHATLNASSHGLIDRQRLALMKPSAYLVNTARSAIVNEQALAAALAAGQLAGAALDVFDDEPLPPDHPLTRLPNVVLTPHVGWPTDVGYERFANAAVDVLLAFMDGKEFPQF